MQQLGDVDAADFHQLVNKVELIISLPVSVHNFNILISYCWTCFILFYILE